LDSIVNQTYINLEIILVDDGSPDGCPQICDEYAAKDKRIVVIHKENGGLSDARNAGLDICKGEYIYFLDGDDIIPQNCILNLFKILIQEEADIVSSSYTEFRTDEQLPEDTAQSTHYITMTGSEALVLLCKNKTPGIMSSCMKIYKKSCFENIRFPKGHLYEDAHTNYIIYHNCKKICYTKSPLYYYRIHNKSITANTTSLIYDLEAREKRYFFLKDHNEPAAEYCVEQLCWDYLLIFTQPQIFLETIGREISSQAALNTFKCYAAVLSRSNQGTKFHRFLINFFSHFPRVYSFLYNMSPWHLRNDFNKTHKND
jgi:glycosyltransferase involved in cell wall biosynthesis